MVKQEDSSEIASHLRWIHIVMQIRKANLEKGHSTIAKNFYQND